jgi:hypothetical protein
VKPLPFLSDAEKAVRQKAAGRDADNLPLSLNAAERKAAANPGLPALKEPPMFSVPPALVSLAKVVAGLCTMALAATLLMDSLPAWVPFALWAWVALRHSSRACLRQASPPPSRSSPGRWCHSSWGCPRRCLRTRPRCLLGSSRRPSCWWRSWPATWWARPSRMQQDGAAEAVK